jgi:hypothetical protein
MATLRRLTISPDLQIGLRDGEATFNGSITDKEQAKAKVRESIKFATEWLEAIEHAETQRATIRTRRQLTKEERRLLSQFRIAVKALTDPPHTSRSEAVKFLLGKKKWAGLAALIETDREA